MLQLGNEAGKRARDEAPASDDAGERDTVVPRIRTRPFQSPESPSWLPRDAHGPYVRVAPRKTTSGGTAATAAAQNSGVVDAAIAQGVAGVREKEVVMLLHKAPMTLKRLIAEFEPLFNGPDDKKRFMEIVTSVARFRGSAKERMCELKEDAIYRYKLDLTEVKAAIVKAEATFEKSVSHLSGLDRVKKKFMKIMLCMLYSQLNRDSRTGQSNHNFIVKGRPGTGKTTLVKAVYEAMRAAGVLTGKFVEVRPVELRSSSEALQEVKNEAGNGMVFIDEAYELETKRQLNTELTRAIDPQRVLPLFVVAGYPKQMGDWLAASNPKGNPGLRSRFAHEVVIPDYSAGDLLDIFKKKLASRGMSITPDSRPLLEKMAGEMAEDPNSNYGRDVNEIVDCIHNMWVNNRFRVDPSLAKFTPHCDSTIVQQGIDLWLDEHPERRPSSVSLDKLTSGALVHASTGSLAASASNYTLPTEVSKPPDPAVAEDVGRVLNALCERADGAIVLLQELSANLEDSVIRKLGGNPGEARNPKSRSSNKRQFTLTLKAYLESIFEVRVIQNTTGRAVADHSRFTGYYAENLRMRDSD